MSMCESVCKNLGSVSKSLVDQDSVFWRRVLFLSVLFALIGWCGFSILSFYATEIFTKSGSPISATHTSWITASTKIFCAILSFYVLHRFSRSVAGIRFLYKSGAKKWHKKGAQADLSFYYEILLALNLISSEKLEPFGYGMPAQIKVKCVLRHFETCVNFD